MDVRTGGGVEPPRRLTDFSGVRALPARLRAVTGVRYRKTLQKIHRLRVNYSFQNALRKAARTDPVAAGHLRDLSTLKDIDDLEVTRRLEEIRAQGSLSAIQWQVLELRIKQGLTYQQIAKNLNMPRSEVLSALMRGYSELRMQLIPVSDIGFD